MNSHAKNYASATMLNGIGWLTGVIRGDIPLGLAISGFLIMQSVISIIHTSGK